VSTLAGHVVDETGVPVGCAVLVLDGVTAVADASGGFAYQGVAPGQHVLGVAAGGYQSEQLPITVGPGQQQISVTLTPSPTATIAGHVVDPAGAPVAGAPVTLDMAQSVTTGADGSFVFADVAPGAHTVDVQAAGWTAATYAVTTAAGETATPTLTLEPLTTPPTPAPSAGLGNGVVLAAAAAGGIAFLILLGPKRRSEYRA
jgi:Carboxypeptidase regulatory-like domain